MLPLLAGAAGAAGMKLAQGAFNNDDEEAKKLALQKLSSNFASQMGSPFGGAAAPPPEAPNPLMEAGSAAGESLIGGALADKKPGAEEPEWWKSAARGALGAR